MEASLQPRIRDAGSASRHRLPLGSGGMVADRSMGLAAGRGDPRCELALHAHWDHANKQKTHDDGTGGRRGGQPSLDREMGRATCRTHYAWLRRNADFPVGIDELSLTEPTFQATS